MIILTGNAAGVTVSQMVTMAEGIDALIGTQGQASEVLALLAGSAQVADQVGYTASAPRALPERTRALAVAAATARRRRDMWRGSFKGLVVLMTTP